MLQKLQMHRYDIINSFDIIKEKNKMCIQFNNLMHLIF